jgi:ribosomal protein RSM22 (predicted rRNA methylase)
MTWSEIDWQILERLRAQFLTGAATSEPYWRSAEDLANYDITYGERIGWKWDHVLRELRAREWQPRSRTILDWGCGSGIAGRRIVSCFGAERFERLTVWDHSPLAANFAAETAQAKFPTLPVTQATPGHLESTEAIGLLVLSHVLNELTPAQRDALRILAARADEILWVEPGTHDVSRRLGAMREQIRAAGYRVIAPCTHQNECPMFALGNERHWCHFFAPPPSEIYADPNWVKFGQRAGIDLRSLPYCFIALEREPKAAAVQDGTPMSRVIGRPEQFKPYVRLLNCDRDGLNELELPKRSDPSLYKQLDRTKAPLVYRWQRDGNKIRSGELVTPAKDPES